LSPPLHLSPNWDERPPGAAVELVILHYTGMASGAAALARLCDPAAAVSAHYLVDDDGVVRLLVPEAKRAWHAGRSAWRGRTGLNDVSIGIELVNPGHEWGYRSFPALQIEALIGLCRDILARHGLGPEAVVAHADVAPDRKEDPGELLDWARLARAGIGIWPGVAPPLPVDPLLARHCLSRIGYGLDQPGVTFIHAVIAFQRRFRPCRVDGALDAETMGRMLAVADLLDGPDTPT
jgi:N-acetylmuramoyl-L-alanine amidase